MPLLAKQSTNLVYVVALFYLVLNDWGGQNFLRRRRNDVDLFF